MAQPYFVVLVRNAAGRFKPTLSSRLLTTSDAAERDIARRVADRPIIGREFYRVAEVSL